MAAVARPAPANNASARSTPARPASARQYSTRQDSASQDSASQDLTRQDSAASASQVQPVHVGQQPTHLRVAAAPKRRLAPKLGWVIAVTVLAALFVVAALQALIVQRQTNLDGLNTELTEVRAINDRLRLNVARASAPERIVAVAINNLGMVEPERRVYLAPAELN
ncbi:MAG: hypothetical protein OXF21_02615 [bacterium]|nr:hypothetical protein [bacterium]